MVDVEQIYKQTYSELKTLGIPVNEATVKLASMSKVPGTCQETENGFEIRIMKKLAENDREDYVKSTMVHELLHTCKDTFNHNEQWRKYVKIAEDYGHYGLYKTISIAQINGEDLPIRELYVCPNCGLSYESVNENEGEKKCPWCNTMMNSVKFDVKTVKID